MINYPVVNYYSNPDLRFSVLSAFNTFHDAKRLVMFRVPCHKKETLKKTDFVRIRHEKCVTTPSGKLSIDMGPFCLQVLGL